MHRLTELARKAKPPTEKLGARQWFANRMGVSLNTVKSWALGNPMRSVYHAKAAKVLNVPVSVIKELNESK